MFGQYKSNRSLWKVPTSHRNKLVLLLFFRRISPVIGKMMSVCVARSLPCLFYVLILAIFAILTSVLTTVNSTLLTFDHQTLLDIGNLISYSPDAVWSGSYIYIYVFSRRFYPKRLTYIQAINFFNYVCSLGTHIILYVSTFASNIPDFLCRRPSCF